MPSEPPQDSDNSRVPPSRVALTVCWLQGVYFLLTGLWPIVDSDSFQLVTGRKTDHLITGREADHWMLDTIGALVAAVAVVLLRAAWRRQLSGDVALLAISTAGALLAIDVVYVARGVLAKIYLADAAVEAVLIAGWVAGLRVTGRGRD
jgi:hypothetical protein